MFPSISKRQLLVVGAVVITLVAANVLGFFWLVRPGSPPDTFGGKVSLLSTSTLIVVDARGHVREFSVGSTTAFSRGKIEITPDLISVGDFVMVITDVPGPLATDARKVRILKDPINKPPKP